MLCFASSLHGRGACFPVKRVLQMVNSKLLDNSPQSALCPVTCDCMTGLHTLSTLQAGEFGGG